MSILFPLEYIMIGMLIVSGLFSLSLAVAKLDSYKNLIFFTIIILIAIYTYGFILRYSATSIKDFVFAEKIIQSSSWFVAALFVHFIEILTNYKSQKIKTVLIVGFCLAGVFSIFSKFGVDYSNIIGLTEIELPWGETITSVDAEISNYFWAMDLLLIFSLYYIIRAINYLYRKENKKLAVIIGIAFSFVIATILFDDFFIETGKVNFPFTQQFAFVTIIFVSGMEGFQSLLKIRKTEIALLNSEAKFKQLTKVSFDGVCITEEGVIVEVNKQMLKMFGYIRENLIGKNINKLFIRTTGESNYNNDLYEKWARKIDGTEFPCELRMRAGEVDGKKIYINVLRDITSRKNYQDQLISARKKAEKSEKLKSEFLAQMSHEIRSPISTILSFASLLAEEVAGKIDAELEDSFGTMNNAAKRIIRTIDLIINMAEVQAGTYEPIKSNVNLVDNVIKEIFIEYKQIAKDAKLEFEFVNRIENDTAIVHCDKYTVSQIFSNLVDNAIKYTPSGRVTIKAEKNEETVVIEIQDTGIGIAKEYMPRIFEKFTQEEQGYTRKYDGNGLGLALVKSYLDINEAKMTVISDKNFGSLFRVEFNLISLN